jgi:hypothetical protein
MTFLFRTDPNPWIRTPDLNPDPEYDLLASIEILLFYARNRIQVITVTGVSKPIGPDSKIGFFVGRLVKF